MFDNNIDKIKEILVFIIHICLSMELWDMSMVIL